MRENNKGNKNNKNKIKTSTINTDTLFLLQDKHSKNNDTETNKEPPNTDCTNITTKYIGSNNNPKNVIIKTIAHPISTKIIIYQFHETSAKRSEIKRIRNQTKKNTIRNKHE